MLGNGVGRENCRRDTSINVGAFLGIAFYLTRIATSGAKFPKKYICIYICVPIPTGFLPTLSQRGGEGVIVTIIKNVYYGEPVHQKKSISSSNYSYFVQGP